MKILQEAIRNGAFLLDVEASDIASALQQMLTQVVARGLLPAEHRSAVESELLDRERQVSTAIGNAVAVPHAYLDALTEPLIVFVRLAPPINLGAPDGVPTRFVFVLLGPTGATAEHLDTLATIARLMSDEEFRYDAQLARTDKDLLAALDHFTARTTPEREITAKPGEGLTYTGKLCGGLRAGRGSSLAALPQ